MESVGGFECSGTTPPINYGAKLTYSYGKDRKVGFVHQERPAQGLQRAPTHLARSEERRVGKDSRYTSGEEQIDKQEIQKERDETEHSKSNRVEMTTQIS